MELTRDQIKTMLQQGALLLLRQKTAEEITNESVRVAITTVADGISKLYEGMNNFGWLPLKEEVANSVTMKLSDLDYTIIVESDVKRESGSFPFKMILARRAKSPDPTLPFVTWVSYEREAGAWANSYGHYDLTFTTACIDFEDRCRRLGIPLGKTWGRLIQSVLSDAVVF